MIESYSSKNFRNDYQIGLRFDTLLEGQKRMEEFVNQPFLTNGSGFIYQKRSYNKQKINFLNHFFIGVISFVYHCKMLVKRFSNSLNIKN